jgi:dTDP-4-dehydrorhamnose reductase
MKIVVTGIAGLLGKALTDELSADHEIIGLDAKSGSGQVETVIVDITDYKKTYDTITKINPDLVLHCAAIADVDGCEKDPDLAFQVNALGTRNLALACQRFDAALLYISTDYVFSGLDNPKDGYTEFDKPNPISEYGRSKLFGEWYTTNLTNKFYVVRTSWLFGENRTNYVTSMAENLSQNKPIKAVDDMVSSPTYVKDLAGAIAKLVAGSRYGIYHVCNQGFASRYDIALMISGLLGAPKTLIKKLTLDELNLAAKRPRFSGLNNYLFKTDGFGQLRPWQDAVREFLECPRIKPKDNV